MTWPLLLPWPLFKTVPITLVLHIVHVTWYIPSVPLKRLDKLSRSIIIWNVEPKSMRNSCWHTFTKAKRVPTNKISTFSKRVIKGIEKQWSWWTQKVLNVLLKCIDLFSRWIIGNLSHTKKYIRKLMYKINNNNKIHFKWKYSMV